jgi:hypothetical protein
MMPIRRRTPKRRRDRAAEAAVWQSVFQTGGDFFDELSDLGGVHPFFVDPKTRPEAERRFMSAARAAWNELGQEFMATWGPNSVRDVPWALEQFGEPRCQ